MKKQPEPGSAAEKIRSLREKTGESRVKFAEHVNIPLRTIEDWEAGKRIPPEYIPRLLSYQLELEGLKAELLAAKCNESEDKQE